MNPSQAVEITQYQKQYLEAFVSLNTQWLKEYFTIEKKDLDIFKNVETQILDPGGQIFFAILDQKAVGTCAMIPYKTSARSGSRVFELAKMAVDPKWRGNHIGSLLIQHAINWAKNQKAQSVVLVSSTKLLPALKLYQKFGFKTEPVDCKFKDDYARCDIQMRLLIS